MIDAALLAALAWIALGCCGLVAPRSHAFAGRVLYPAGAAVGVLVAAIAGFALFDEPSARVLPLGLPDLPFHARLDALSAFFLALLGGVAAGVSVFASGYLRADQGSPPGLVCLCYHVFLASMAL